MKLHNTTLNHLILLKPTFHKELAIFRDINAKDAVNSIKTILTNSGNKLIFLNGSISREE